MFINFSDLPGQQNLVLDYLYEFDNVKYFYNKNFRDEHLYQQHFDALAARKKSHKELLPGIIKEQYAQNSISELTKKNIETLGKANSMAVVTGQQLGLFSGPLYTIYKIVTAIKLANSLADKFKNNDFIPVFWLEADDHDFEEVRSVKLIDENSEPVTISYDDGRQEEINRGSVGKIQFNENIESVLKELDELLRNNDFKFSLLNKLESFYKPGKTFKESFRDLIFDLFDSYGLVIFDPQDHAVKNLLKPVFKKEICEYTRHTSEVVKISAELEETYHAQVKINPINLFLSENDGRYLIEPSEDEYKLKNKRKRFDRETLLFLIENEPHRFSPNVLLRPVCQDYIFSTAFYIAGPGEISYFAQVMPLYKIFDIEQPIIYPRASVTIIEKYVKKVLDKYNLSYLDFFEELKVLFEKVLRSIADIELDSVFLKCETSINQAIADLRNAVVSIDKTLNDVTVRTEEKITQVIIGLKEKTQEAQKKQHEITLRQVTKVSNLIFPHSNLQEREISFIYFAHKYGLNIIERIFEETQIDKFEHQIIEL